MTQSPPSSARALGDALAALADTISERKLARTPESGSTSYTAQLLAAGPQRIAKKIGEEGVELALALAVGTDKQVSSEMADLIYHALVGLAARGISLDQIAQELEARAGVSGLSEKASRSS